MKKMVVLSFLFLFASFSNAQTEGESNKNSAPISIVQIGIDRNQSVYLNKVETNASYIPVFNNSSIDQQIAPDTIRQSRQLETIKPEVTIQNRSVIVFKNNASKRISLIEYNFFILNEKGVKIRSFSFKDEVKLKSGKTVKISNTLDFIEPKALLKFSAEIITVKYDDGTTWNP